MSRDNKEADLSDVFVQIKLVVVEPAEALEMIPQISRYANSQNRVSEADFFSNSPFHVRLEELSRRVLVPAESGKNFQTKWFYERTRGQYQNEKNKLSVKDQRQFEAQFPRAQMMTKTDAAKYEVTWQMQPHVVSAGAQKNFKAFAELVQSKWDASNAAFNELYFRHLVAKSILFNQVRKAIASAPWYDKGYLANLVTYTIAKLAHDVGHQARGGAFDLDRVWADQAATPATIAECLEIGEKVLKALTSDHRPVQNVTEWSKRPQCWATVQAIPHALSPALLEELESRTVLVQKKREATSTQKVDSGIAAQTKVITMQPSEWVALREFTTKHRIATPTDLGILELVTGQKAGFPSEKQCVRLLQLLAKAEEIGFVDA